MIRRFGEQPLAEISYTHRPGVYVILPQGDQVLLTYQSEPTPEFQLPGGGVDPGENPMAALHREVMEETGWIISAPKRLGAFRRFTYMPEYDLHAEKLCTIYAAAPIYKRGDPLEDDHDPVWADMETALSLLGNDGDAHFLEHFMALNGLL